MTALVIGLSHRTAPVWMLERVTVPAGDIRKLLDELHDSEVISEVLLLSTCNRVEVYADVARFHQAEAEIRAVLARHAGLSITELSDHLYLHFAEAATEHMFSVASGLDSMVIGESQILGQLRAAYAAGTEAGTVGSVLHDLAQTALRVGKRVHAETGIDRAGASVVSVALDHAAVIVGPLEHRRVLVLGAGSMGALAAATLHRRGVPEIVLANRTPERAERIAAGVGARAVPLEALTEEIAAADVLVSCTGSTGIVVDTAHVDARGDRPLVVLDIALPHDVAPAVGELPGVTYVDLEGLRADGAMVSDAEAAAATAIVAGELREHLVAQQRLAVAPTVTALRARADQVIDAELARLDSRLPALSDTERREVADAVRRAVEKVLHAPTVRVKELASTPGGDQYAVALRELFDLDPATAESVTAVKK